MSEFYFNDKLDDSQKEILEALVAPWFPNAKVEDHYITTSCGCYSEVTTEPCSINITFEAPTDKTDTEIAKTIRAIEDLVCDKIESMFDFSGCNCCSGNGDDYDDDNVYISKWIRVIPKREKNA